MPRIAYTLCYCLLLPLILLRLLYRARRAPAYAQRIAERFGIFRAAGSEHTLWVHAVSVGETIAAAPLIRQLQSRYPQYRVVVTTMTPTGSERVRALFGDSVFHVYAPYDLPWAISAFIARTRPAMLIVMETELWPNMVDGCYRRGIPVLLANARLSARSARGYRRLGALSAAMLRQLAAVAAQHTDDGQRFIELGLPAERLQVIGSVKYDVDIEPDLRAQAASLRSIWQGAAAGASRPRPIWLAASTHAGEDEQLLEAYRQLLPAWPDLLLVLVPRHPERFDRVAGLCEQAGFALLRRSSARAPDAQTQVLLGDSMGELMLFYGAADLVFVGGSLVDRGGHNMLEPAAWGRALITGVSDYNFLAISAALSAAGALHKVADAPALAELAAALLADAARREQMGAAALAVVQANRGALDALLAMVARLRASS